MALNASGSGGLPRPLRPATTSPRPAVLNQGVVRSFSGCRARLALLGVRSVGKRKPSDFT